MDNISKKNILPIVFSILDGPLLLVSVEYKCEVWKRQEKHATHYLTENDIAINSK